MSPKTPSARHTCLARCVALLERPAAGGALRADHRHALQNSRPAVSKFAGSLGVSATDRAHAAAADAHAQYEIRVYAEAIAAMTADWVPLAYAAFEDYRMGGATLSSKAIDVVKRMIKGEEVTRETSGMSIGEWREFQGVIG